MIALLRLLAITVGTMAGAMYLFKTLFSTDKWKKSIPQADIDSLKQVLDLNPQPVVEMDAEEWDLISLNHTAKQVKRSGRKIMAGTFSSIYEEPQLNYAYLAYTDEMQLIAVDTKEQDYIYKYRNGSVDIYCNGNLMGILTRSGKVIAPDKKTELLEIELTEDSQYQRISIEGKEVAAILNPYQNEGTNLRVIQFHELDKSKRHNLLFGLIYFNMIYRCLNK